MFHPPNLVFGMATYLQAATAPIITGNTRYTEPAFVAEALSITVKDTTRLDAIAESFSNLAKKWKEETGGMSSMSQITSNKNYLGVLLLGRPVVKYIIDDLRKEAAPWFFVLSLLSGRDDIGREHRGHFRKIANAWIEWWEKEGYLVCQ